MMHICTKNKEKQVITCPLMMTLQELINNYIFWDKIWSDFYSHCDILNLLTSSQRKGCMVYWFLHSVTVGHKLFKDTFVLHSNKILYTFRYGEAWKLCLFVLTETKSVHFTVFWENYREDTSGEFKEGKTELKWERYLHCRSGLILHTSGITISLSLCRASLKIWVQVQPRVY